MCRAGLARAMRCMHLRGGCGNEGGEKGRDRRSGSTCFGDMVPDAHAAGERTSLRGEKKEERRRTGRPRVMAPAEDQLTAMSHSGHPPGCRPHPHPPPPTLHPGEAVWRRFQAARPHTASLARRKRRFHNSATILCNSATKFHDNTVILCDNATRFHDTTTLLSDTPRRFHDSTIILRDTAPPPHRPTAPPPYGPTALRPHGITARQEKTEKKRETEAASDGTRHMSVIRATRRRARTCGCGHSSLSPE